jgi:hypothetical protein
LQKLWQTRQRTGNDAKDSDLKISIQADILKLIEENEALAYIAVSASAYKIDEELFSYNKDSDQWFCVMGHETLKVSGSPRWYPL